MGKISKTGIAPQQQIKAEHITRIIDALSGETPLTQIEISGSVTASYFVGDGSGLINLPIPSGSGGNVYERITRSQAELMFSSSLFIPGLNYAITDADVNLYGGTEITLTAITPSELSLQGSGKFYCPKYDLSADGTGYGIWTKQMEGTFSNIVGTFTQGETLTAQNGATAKYLAEGFLEWIEGDWNLATNVTGVDGGADVSGFITPDYFGEQVVHWGGKSWVNIADGVVGNSIDKYSLSPTEWQEIPFNETDYNVYIDEIHYDFGNDMIIYRKDRYNNVVRGSHQVFTIFEFGYGNPIKDFQWGCMKDDFNTNDFFTLGIQGNEVIDSYFETLNTRGKYIWLNKLSQISVIKDNILSKTSFFNSNTLSGGSYFFYNTLSNSSIHTVTLSGGSSIQSNTLSGISSIRVNTLSINSSIKNNTLSNSCSIGKNALSSSSNIENNTFSSSNIENNTLSGGQLTFSNEIISKTVSNLQIINNNVSIPNKATIIFNISLSKTIFRREDGTPRLQYVNNSDVIVITDVDA